MLSLKSIKASDASGTAHYYEDLAHEDYYTSGGEPPGKWVGSYAAGAGLAGAVERGDLESALAGYHPRTGEAIANNAGPDHKPGYDLTFSAPKSVSVVWATADKEVRQAISEAQQQAVEATIGYAEASGVFRQRAGHAGEQKIAHGEIAAATFEHSTSRNLDPDLHTHAVVPNLAANGKTVDFDAKRKHELGAYYRAALAERLRGLGFETEQDKFSFKIAGVPKQLCEDLSSRRQEIEKHLAEKGMSSAKASEVATFATRQKKGEINREQLFAKAAEKAKEYGFRVENVRGAAAAPRKFDEDAFVKKTWSQASTLTDIKLREALLVAAQDTMSPAEALGKVDELKQSGKIIELRDSQTGERRWTSQEMFDIERDLARGVATMAQKEHKASAADPAVVDVLAKKHGLSPEQAGALKHLTGEGSLAAIHGIAGAGKSRIFDAAREIWEAQGCRVIGCALAGKAAQGLEESAHLKKSYSVEGLLYALGDLNSDGCHDAKRREHLSPKTVVIVDEAGMLDSRRFGRLLEWARVTGAKVAMSGDTRQVQPIDAGGAFRTVCDQVGAYELNEIWRQKDPHQREIVRAMADGRAGDAIELMRSSGQIHEHQTQEQARIAVAHRTAEDLAQGKTAIVTTGTRGEAFQVNQLARDRVRELGLLRGADVSFRVKNAAGGDEMRTMAVGERVLFLKNQRLGWEGGHAIRRRNGRLLIGKDGQPVIKGGTPIEVKNGSTGTVVGISPIFARGDGIERHAEMRVKLDNGKEVSFSTNEYGHLDHGYAFTTHKSQGVTVDNARALIDEQMIDRHLAYVQTSRHKELMEWHGTPEQFREAETLMSRDRTKDTSADYEIEGRDTAGGLSQPRMNPVSGGGTDDQTNHLEEAIRGVERMAAAEQIEDEYSEKRVEDLIASRWMPHYSR